MVWRFTYIDDRCGGWVICYLSNVAMCWCLHSLTLNKARCHVWLLTLWSSCWVPPPFLNVFMWNIKHGNVRQFSYVDKEFHDLFIVDCVVAELCARYPKATELHLKGAPCVDEGLVCEAMTSLRWVITLYYLMASLREKDKVFVIFVPGFRKL